MVLGPPLLLALFGGDEAAQVIVGLVNPLLTENTWEAKEPPWMVVASIGFWSVGALVLFVLNTRLLPRRASQ